MTIIKLFLCKLHYLEDLSFENENSLITLIIEGPNWGRRGVGK
jgi:hypothetical protein